MTDETKKNRTEREKLAARIKALLEKTVENGCSHEEAMAAAEKARELADKYQIDLTSAEFEAEGAEHGIADEPILNYGVNIQLWMASEIANFTDCKVWVGKINVADEGEDADIQTRVQYLGLTSDVDFAFWLTVHLEDFVWFETAEYVAKLEEDDTKVFTPKGLKLEARAFAAGACNRISERLRELTAERRKKDPKISDGKSLIVVKNAIVNEAFKTMGLRLGKSRAGGFQVGGQDARAAGRAAGDKATFGRPVNAGKGAAQIAAR